MRFTRGMKKIEGSGRKRGTPNVITKTLREAILIAYDQLGGHEGFCRWAQRNRNHFYRLAVGLVPVEKADPKNDSDSRVQVFIPRVPGQVIDSSHYVEVNRQGLPSPLNRTEDQR